MCIEHIYWSAVQRVNRLDYNINSRQQQRSKTWSYFHNVAFNYDATIDYLAHCIMPIGRMDRILRKMKWQGETISMCCSNGKVHIPLIAEPPEL